MRLASADFLMDIHGVPGGSAGHRRPTQRSCGPSPGRFTAPGGNAAIQSSARAADAPNRRLC
ncbi:MAG: hypothetical protein JWN52_2773 [Actinomycetia bacterium]|nr:hypothetical protein [Actinomycetes bacterium]